MQYRKDRYEKFLASLPEYVKDIVPADAIYDCYKNGSSAARVRANLIDWAEETIAEYADEIQQAGGVGAVDVATLTDAGALYATARACKTSDDVQHVFSATNVAALGARWIANLAFWGLNTADNPRLCAEIHACQEKRCVNV